MKVVRVAGRQCNTQDTVEDDHGQAQREVDRGTKISIITNVLRRALPEIKLKRTDTTLDLSQKAKRAEEKRRGKQIKKVGGRRGLYIPWAWSVRLQTFHWAVCKGCKPTSYRLPGSGTFRL
jgi:hypothetical protein